MPFSPNQPIVSCDIGPTRWVVKKTWVWNSIRFAWVADGRPELKAPMSRRALACCLELDPSADEWLIREWRRQFGDAIRALGTGFAGLSEPVDFFHAPARSLGHVPGPLREEPIVVYIPEPGTIIAPYPVTALPPAAIVNDQLTTLIKGLAEILKTVHDAGHVLRNIPLLGVTWNHSARAYGIREWLGIAAFGPSNYHRQIGFPTLDVRWTAPECFEPEALLTPATDVYALGRTVLAFLGHVMPRQPLLPAVHDAVEAATVRFQGRLPERIRRLLLLALHPLPKQRLRNMDQVVGMLFDGPEPPRVPVAPPRPRDTVDNRFHTPEPPQHPASVPSQQPAPGRRTTRRKPQAKVLRQKKYRKPRGGP